MLKKIALMTLVLGLLCAAPAWAGNLSVSRTEVDFGSMTEGPVAEKAITLTNTGKEVVTIENVTTSWSCTSTALGQRSLEPGESTELVIRYNTYKYPGKFEKSVTVFTGKDDAKGQTISIVGFVDPIPMGVMEVEPRKTPVDGLKAGKACPAKILVKNTGDAPMTVTAVKSQKFKATYWEGTLVIQPGQSAPVEFAVSPAEAGRFMDIIMVHSDARNDIGKGYKAVLTGEAE